MFVQVIEGRVRDADGLRRQMDRWAAELLPGAAGYLGSTGGIAADGTAITIVRFESAEAAAANSARPEQGAWWAETETCFDGPVEFAESTEVDQFLAGGSDDAGFVQVMKGSADRARLREMDGKLSQLAAQWRPDLIGGLRVWTAPEDYVEVAYFTSEAEARENEQAEPPAEFAAEFAEFAELMADVTYVDLPEPMFMSS